ncbi:hypothetical protein ACQ86N_15905 [Puia sp. P3]|uniref:hypothetical protein n=1 Tax=Puia sp. P3 TaxID=3423952 RepID=UPI003D67B4B3
MKTLFFVSAALLALSSCTKDVVVPDSYYYTGYSSDPYYNPYLDPNSPYYDPNYDPYTDPNYAPYSDNSIKPGIHTVTPGNAPTFNSGTQNGAAGSN